MLMKRSLPFYNLLIITALALLLTVNGYSQTTYTWNNAAGGAYGTSTNWSPERTTPANNDILVFSDGGTYTVTGIATQTIGKLQVSNGTKVTLNAGTTGQTLTIAGGTDTDLQVASGCELNISTANTLTLALPTGATGSISGNMTFLGGAQKLTAVDASAVTFNSGAIFSTGTGFSSNPFGTTNLNSIIFASGSTFVFTTGSNPFGATAPNSVVVFQTGSVYKHKSSNTPSVANRIFANFEYDYTATVTVTGTTPFTMDNLTVTSGTFNVNMTGTGSTGATIKGNVNVAAGANLSFSPASAGNVTFAGASTQTINCSGNLSMGANATIVLNQNIELNCPLPVTAGINLKDKTVSGTGTLSVGGSSVVTTANTAGLDATVLTIANKTFSTGASYIYNGTAAQMTGDLLPSTVNNLAINNSSGVSLTSNQTVTTSLSFAAGNLTLGDKNLTIASGGNIVSSYDKYIVTNGTGTLTMTFANGSTPLFGFGTAASYAPVICNITSSGNTIAGSVSSTITHPALHNDRLVQLQWYFTETGGNSNSGSCVFAWNNAAAKGSAFDITKPVVFASWSGTAYNRDDVTVTDLGNGMYGITLALPPNIPATPLLIGNKSAFLPDAPALTADNTLNDVEHDIVITFTDDATWRSAVTGVYINGTGLSPSDYTLEAGTLTLKPSNGNALLTTAGEKNVAITAYEYNDATVIQPILAGAINLANTTVSFTPEMGPGVTTNCTITAQDQYHNAVQGYFFKYDVTITDNDVMTNETYGFNGLNFDASVIGGSLLTGTDAAGVNVVNIMLPAVIDGGDGISVQIKLNDGTTNVGSASSYIAPNVPNIRINAPVALTETNLNGATINVTVGTETFADNTIDPANVTLNNAPAGLTVNSATWVTSTTATITLAFTGADFDANITNLNITIAGAEFTLANPLTSNDLTVTAVVETAPVVATNATVTALGMFTATWGGEVTSDGGAAVTQKGVCWSLATVPTIADSKTEEGAGTGTITGSMTGLTSNAVYYVRAYATNSVGTAYGDEHTFTTLAPFEDFAGFGETTSSYKDGSFTGRDGSTWTYVQCSGNPDVDINPPSPVLAKGKAPAAEVKSGTLHNGIGKLTFKYAESYTTAVNLDVYVNDVKVANVTTLSSETMVVKTSPEIDVYVTGDFTLRFVQNNTGSGQVTIDDISWTPYAPVNATVEAPRFSPLPGSYIGAQDITITSATADAQIYYTLDDTDPTAASTPYTAPVHLTSSDVIKAIAIKTGMDNSPVVTASYSIEQVTEVANITALRAGTVGNVYKLTGEAVLTFQTTTQKYVQDAGAGIQVYDNAGIIKTTYNQYDGITGITGRLALYYGVLELIPVFNTSAASSTGNTVTPISVTLTELNTNYEQYESRIIKVSGVTFSSTGNFTSSTNYNISDGTNTSVFRAAFSSSDYIGTAIPSGKVNLTGLAMENNGTAQIASRNLADIYVLATAKAITSFAFNGLTPAVNATINENAKTITATVPAGTNRTALVPTIAVSAKATVDPASGVAKDFTNAVTYTVTAEDGSTATYTVTVSLATGIDDNLAGKLKLYPVPAQDEIFARNIEDVTMIEIFDVTGNKRLTEKCEGENEVRIDISRLARGIYFAKFTTTEGTVMKRFVKE